MRPMPSPSFPEPTAALGDEAHVLLAYLDHFRGVVLDAVRDLLHLLHLLQEYARHAGHLDVVVELAQGQPE